MFKVTLILGDGTGPELCAVVKKVLAATGVPLEWEEVEAGVDALEKYGTPLPRMWWLRSAARMWL